MGGFDAGWYQDLFKLYRGVAKGLSKVYDQKYKSQEAQEAQIITTQWDSIIWIVSSSTDLPIV